jgi:hypothetical protein
LFCFLSSIFIQLLQFIQLLALLRPVALIFIRFLQYPLSLYQLLLYCSELFREIINRHHGRQYRRRKISPFSSLSTFTDAKSLDSVRGIYHRHVYLEQTLLEDGAVWTVWFHEGVLPWKARMGNNCSTYRNPLFLAILEDIILTIADHSTSRNQRAGIGHELLETQKRGPWPEQRASMVSRHRSHRRYRWHRFAGRCHRGDFS